jgi:hypothetical protein
MGWMEQASEGQCASHFRTGPTEAVRWSVQCTSGAGRIGCGGVAECPGGHCDHLLPAGVSGGIPLPRGLNLEALVQRARQSAAEMHTSGLGATHCLAARVLSPLKPLHSWRMTVILCVVSLDIVIWQPAESAP